MKGRTERRRPLQLNLKGDAERHFIILEFVLLMLTMLYLLYLVSGTIHGMVGQVTFVDQEELVVIFDKIILLLLIRIPILFLVAFFVHFFLGLFYLHRLTGPLIRIRAILGQIADGRIPSSEFTLRKGDFPKDVAKALSQAIKQIRQWSRNLPA